MESPTAAASSICETPQTPTTHAATGSINYSGSSPGTPTTPVSVVSRSKSYQTIPISDSTPIHSLPVELLLKIFSHLDYKSITRSTQICQLWCELLYAAPEFWTRLDLSNRFAMGSEKPVITSPIERTLELLLTAGPSAPRFAKLKHLSLSCTNVDLEVFGLSQFSCPAFKSLTHLSLNGCSSVEPGSLMYLQHLPSLTSLDLSHCEQVDDTALEVVSYSCPNLTQINLSYLFRITAFGINRLFRLPIESINIMGSPRVKTYPWGLERSSKAILPLRELQIGEDAKVQGRGYWLVWCVFTFSFSTLSQICPHLEVLKLNCVIFDSEPNALSLLFAGCQKLKQLSLVVDRASIPILVEHAERMKKLDTLEVTVHIGVSADLVTSLVDSKALTKLTALKFHSKHTSVVANDATFSNLIETTSKLEYLELNASELSPTGLSPLATATAPKLTSLLLHHAAIAPETCKQLAAGFTTLRELAISNLSSRLSNGGSTRLSYLAPLAGTPMTKTLRKLELSAHRGFSDHDLAKLVSSLPTLQWADLSFAFVYIKTLDALGTTCTGLLYLRLARYPPPVTPRPSTAAASRPAGGMVTATPNNNLDAAIVATPGDDERLSNIQWAALRESDRAKPPKSGSKALVHFAKTYGQKLRVFDLSGNVGLNDDTLVQLSGLKQVHTLFVEQIGSISSKGLVHFCETKYGSLRRVYLRGCRNVKLSCIDVNFLSRGLEVEVVLDGTRVGAGGAASGTIVGL
ncbi:hypothetical protein SmJEL517_g02914 [Synchytrium microbalum]|uniref:F-box domain-containing protein n=1 Tax=Synchytrium microbalum TaxID=1806994 RepID=A0A507C5T5_9FUNG|nr:uncharacterized protein SmJEL517_g02914 [Synchytrium microbalum]TPX34459.1 hypothetical protein SmJEL517_g02914 [Synchytrium microbalum]